MRIMYRGSYAERFEAIADSVKVRSSVLDLCCGPAILYFNYLRKKEVDYTGVDINANFLRFIEQRDGVALNLDIRTIPELPKAETIIMQASLYHFLPNVEEIIDKMLAAASEQVIIAEPIRNFATNSNPFIAWLARTISNPGTGDQHNRFTETTLDELMKKYQDRVIKSYYIPGEREKIYILKGG